MYCLRFSFGSFKYTYARDQPGKFSLVEALLTLHARLCAGQQCHIIPCMREDQKQVNGHTREGQVQRQDKFGKYYCLSVFKLHEADIQRTQMVDAGQH